MKRVTLIATAMVLAVLVGMSARVAAQNTVPSERTFMTFSNTVEMPGVTLPAGTYVFRLADTPTRNVVQVLSGDEKKVLGQWTFVQAERPKVSEDTVVMFKETPEGTMPAVQVPGTTRVNGLARSSFTRRTRHRRLPTAPASPCCLKTGASHRP